MNSDFLLSAKVILFVLLWFFNLVFIVFIFKSRKFYNQLTQFESICSTKRKEAVSCLVPVLINISEKNKKLNLLLNINNQPLKETIAFAISSFLPIIGIFQIINSGFNLTKLMFSDSHADPK